MIAIVVVIVSTSIGRCLRELVVVSPRRYKEQHHEQQYWINIIKPV